MRTILREIIAPATIAELVATALFLGMIAVWAAVLGG
jgi:hypothetical protein